MSLDIIHDIIKMHHCTATVAQSVSVRNRSCAAQRSTAQRSAVQHTIIHTQTDRHSITWAVTAIATDDNTCLSQTEWTTRCYNQPVV